MKKVWMKKLAVGMAACLLTCSIFSGIGFTKAATFNDINQASVFLKQPGGSNTCTLVAATMLVRRAAMMNGNERWSAITEDVMRSVAWVEGTGLKWDFNCSGITVTHDSFSGNPSELQTKLSEHPEGIVLYKQKLDQQHAVLVTDYTDGVFYCADPSGAKEAGRIPMASASITVEDSNYIWYVSSPTLYLTNDSGSTIPHVVETPKPTAKPTSTPVATPTAKPKTSEKPTTSEKPKTTATPKTSGKPKTTATPKTSGKPKTSAKPKTSEKPKEDTGSSGTVKAPKKVKGVSIKNNKKKTLTITWKKVSGAKGYQLRFGTSKNLSGGSTAMLTGRRAALTDLTKGRVFYVKVRAYKLNGKKKVYGSYSTVKKGKVKK